MSAHKLTGRDTDIWRRFLYGPDPEVPRVMFRLGHVECWSGIYHMEGPKSVVDTVTWDIRVTLANDMDQAIGARY